MTPDPEELDPDWSKYPDTVLRFAPDLAIDLREPLSADSVEALRSMGLTDMFAVLTAQDPNGRDLDPAENRRRAGQLELELANLGVFYVRVEACSPDGSHCESSVAAALDQERAVELAKNFEQVAIFWFDGRKFWIVGGVIGGDPVMLPRPF